MHVVPKSQLVMVFRFTDSQQQAPKPSLRTNCCPTPQPRRQMALSSQANRSFVRSRSTIAPLAVRRVPSSTPRALSSQQYSFKVHRAVVVARSTAQQGESLSMNLWSRRFWTTHLQPIEN